MRQSSSNPIFPIVPDCTIFLHRDKDPYKFKGYRNMLCYIGTNNLLLAGYRPDIGLLLAGYRSTIGLLLAGYRPDIGLLLAV